MTRIENTIRDLLPIESLLKENMECDSEGEDATPPQTLFENISSFAQTFNESKKRRSQSQLIGGGQDVMKISSSMEDSPVISKRPLHSLSTPPRDYKNTDTELDEDTKSVHDILDARYSSGEDDRKSDACRFEKDNHQKGGNEFPSEQEWARDNAEPATDEKHNREKTSSGFATDSQSSENTIDKGLSAANKKQFFETFDPESLFDPLHEENVKLIPLGKTIQDNSRTNDKTKLDSYNKENKDADSENSEDNVRVKYNIGGEEFINSVCEDIPSVKQKQAPEKIDLDVYSANEELPIGPSRFDNTEDSRLSKPKVPSLDGLDTANFFSDID
ncbi:hypothetical protein BDK51DRAFT_50045 [Blyttiomyces helicus]|uniref:Uncharacterized protein n=1 Tax=Blyttiomyces helicus TaxID=388810 RepID=A0A4V1ISR9_9FUNG|nr:hypothetical protein BDK51DRAFT_50045 [Blyttiomyces helicus]|eukprot:RKO94517.1 hypothetical protein BDK51DRAFT_50045 [Blyttiomyces helicus]